MPMRVCDVDGCERAHFAHGYCGMHSRRFIRHGDPLGGGPTPNRDYADPHYLAMRALPAAPTRDYNDPTYTAALSDALQRHHGWFDDGTLEMTGPEFRADAMRRYLEEAA